MNAKDHHLDESAVSPVIGEMLMIVLALLLVSLFSLTLLDFLPSERSPWVDITMNNSCENVTLWHKGGDWIKRSDLQVVIIKDKRTYSIPSSDDSFKLVDLNGNPSDSNSFDIGDRINVQPGDITFKGGEIVRLVSKRGVVFSGVTAPPPEAGGG
ncbi:type IV pilin [Methanofollis ethanolicus]|uniref:type IV pilin n=1 Tax=Methanofollis ethanolicus TaxID=488124 RepID=UPI000832783E|nr:type IV pilin [Methanofollis ethanolicus]